MWVRTTVFRSFLALAAATALTGRAVAELLNTLFPDGVPGYDMDDGVTVDTRLHPEQMPLGIREDGLLFMPRLDAGMGYTSNAASKRASWFVASNPALGVGSTWSRGAFGALFSIRDTRYLSLPSQDRTDGTAAIGGRIDIGDGKLALAAAHVVQHEDRGQIDAIAADRPIAFQLDDLRASYELDAGRWRITPSLQLTNWTYSEATMLGVPVSQSYRDRLVSQAGLSFRYELAPLRDLLLVLRVIGQEYTHQPAGQHNPTSARYQMLAGIDYDDDAVWRWRLLLGAEARNSVSYRTQDTLIAEAGAGWFPSGMTSVGVTISRETQDAAQEGVSGLVYTSARLTIDHEYQRDVLLHASAGLQRADFFQAGHQTATSFGLGITWVLNRSARLAATYDQIDLRGISVATDEAVTGYSRGVGLVTMRLSL